MSTHAFNSMTKLVLVAFLIAASVGCQSYGPKELIPANEVLNRSCCQPNSESQINFLTLRRTPPEQYVLDKGDTLGIYIQGVTGDKDVPPPVNFPDANGGNAALGYPVPVRDDGFISLPLIAPVRVSGLTVGEAEAKIIRAYTRDKQILLEGNEKIIVTLMKPRNYNVLVIREDVGGNQQSALNRNQVYLDEGRTTESFSIELPAYENDVLHALSETGGMPGERAKNEIIVLRGGMNKAQGDIKAIVQAIGDVGYTSEAASLNEANVIRIPIRGDVGTFPRLTEEMITLEDGDVVFIEGRQRDVFYTGGLLNGGRFPLPRDYELDVLEAISMAGGSASAASGAGGSGAFRGIGSIMPPTQVTVLRKCGCEQVAIDVDLRYALSTPSERVIIQPGDMIILEYRKNELAVNTVASIFQFGGIFNLFR